MGLTRVLGLDVSLAATGVAELRHVPDSPAPWGSSVHTVPTAKLVDGSADLLRRFEYLASYLSPHIRQADLVVIEGPAYATKTSHAHSVAGAWWSVYRQAHRAGVSIMEIPPTVLKRYATGRGNADKASVIVGTCRMWPDVNLTDGNQADALVLASIGAHALGLGVPYSATQDRQKIIDKHGDMAVIE